MARRSHQFPPDRCLSAYRLMWLFVFFDLPTHTKTDRREAGRFRNRLLKDGYTMMQFSVYIRHCASRESADVHLTRLNAMLPPKGQVSVAQFTDKQFSRIQNFWGTGYTALPPPPPPPQLELF